MVSIWLWNQCNLDCVYCDQHSNEFLHNKNGMSSETLLQLINFLKSNNSPSTKSITFFGGEPILAADFFVKAITLIRYNGFSGPIKVVTNGISINDKVIESIKEHQIDVVLSFDGLYNSQTRGSSNNLLPILENLTKVVSTVNYVVFDLSKYLENIHFIWSCGFNVIDDIDYIGNKKFSDEEYESFKNQYIKCVDLMIQSHETPDSPKLLLRSAVAFSESEYTDWSCGWHRNALCVGVDGYFYPCQRGPELGPAYSVGDIKKGINHEKLSQLRNLPIGYCVVRRLRERENVFDSEIPRHLNKMMQIRNDVISSRKNKILKLWEELKKEDEDRREYNHAKEI